MSVETELAALTTATSELLNAVTIKRTDLDEAVEISTNNKIICNTLSAASLVLVANQFGAL